MTNPFWSAIVCDRKQDQAVRKGKAMLQLYTHHEEKLYRLDGRTRTIALPVNQAGELLSTCLYRSGTSGYLCPSAPMRAGK